MRYIRICCWTHAAAAPGGLRDRSISLGRRAHSSKPAAVDKRDRQTDGRTSHSFTDPDPHRPTLRVASIFKLEVLACNPVTENNRNIHCVTIEVTPKLIYSLHNSTELYIVSTWLITIYFTSTVQISTKYTEWVLRYNFLKVVHINFSFQHCERHLGTERVAMGDIKSLYETAE